MLTDISHFKGIIRIEGLSETEGAFGIALRDDIEQYISIYEPSYIRRLLGCEVSVKFMNYIKNRDEIESEKNEQWEYLIDWLTNQELNPIACYVFFFYVRNNNVTATSAGVVKNNSDNPVVSPNSKIITAWNAMVGIHHYLFNWIEDNIPDAIFDKSLLEPINSLGI